MSNDLRLFKKFPNLEQARDFQLLLKDEGIDCHFIDNSPPLDLTFTGNQLQNEIQVLVRKSDYNQALQILHQQAQKAADLVDNDHYLFDFSNEEIYEILLRPEEWSELDQHLAKRILNDRGLSVDTDLIESLRKQRINEMSKPEGGQLPWILLGYFFAFQGGLIGMVIGWYLWSSTKTLPNGNRVYRYSRNNQKHGVTIFVIGLICLILSIILFFTPVGAQFWRDIF